MIDDLKKNAKRILSLLSQPQEFVQPGSLKINLLNYHASKAESRDHMILTYMSDIQSIASKLSPAFSNPENATIIIEIQTLAKGFDVKNLESTSSGLKHLLLLADRVVKLESGMNVMNVKIPSLPDAIREEVSADLHEIRACMANGCYRSATILCGRILETALHRKYYDVTGIDILEKNPGIGLGNLIAKLVEKNVSFDPGLTQQIHLINQVRIFSVHKKQEAFKPSKAQAEAIMLYTMDALEKLFKKTFNGPSLRSGP